MAVDLAALKSDLDIPLDDTRDDDVLLTQLDAARAFAREVRTDLNWDAVPDSDLPDPSAMHELGVVRLAGRWYTRRRAPDGLVQSNELGSSTLPAVDLDISRMLGIGRYARPVIA